MAEEFDAIIIGAGQSGPFLAVRLAEQGQKLRRPRGRLETHCGLAVPGKKLYSQRIGKFCAALR